MHILCRSVWHSGELNLIPVSGDLSLYSPVVLFSLDIRAIVATNRNIFDSKHMLINISGSHPANRENRVLAGLFEVMRELA
jgi:hypothetical protein